APVSGSGLAPADPLEVTAVPAAPVWPWPTVPEAPDCAGFLASSLVHAVIAANPRVESNINERSTDGRTAWDMRMNLPGFVDPRGRDRSRSVTEEHDLLRLPWRHSELLEHLGLTLARRRPDRSARCIERFCNPAVLLGRFCPAPLKTRLGGRTEDLGVARRVL